MEKPMEPALQAIYQSVVDGEQAVRRDVRGQRDQRPVQLSLRVGGSGLRDQESREEDTRRWTVGIDPQRGLVLAHGVRNAALVGVGVPQVLVQRCAGDVAQRQLEVRNGLVGAAHRAQDAAEVVVSLGVIRAEPQCPLQVDHCPLKVAGL
jgi:hypothetical protein